MKDLAKHLRQDAGVRSDGTARLEILAAAEIDRLRVALQDAVNRCYDCGGDGTFYPHDPDEVPGSSGVDCPNCKKQREALERK